MSARFVNAGFWLDAQPSADGRLTYPASYQDILTFEPAAFVRIGYQHLKFELQTFFYQ